MYGTRRVESLCPFSGCAARASLQGPRSVSTAPAWERGLAFLTSMVRREPRQFSHELPHRFANRVIRCVPLEPIGKPWATRCAVAAARYAGATLRTAEEARDRAQQVRVAHLRRRSFDGPVLTMPAGGSGTSDTTDSVGIPAVGTVFFRNFTLSVQWAVSTPTAASCALPMGPHCPDRQMFSRPGKWTNWWLCC